MVKSTSRIAASLVLSLFLMVPALLYASFDSSKVSVSSQEKIDRQVDSVFRKLSTREKIAQLIIIDFRSHDYKE